MRQSTTPVSDACENVWFEFAGTGTPNLVLGSCYIPPTAANRRVNAEGMNLLSSTISKINSNHKRVISCGDFNARCKIFGDTDDNSLTKPFLQMLGDNQLFVANSYGGHACQ